MFKLKGLLSLFCTISVLLFSFNYSSASETKNIEVVAQLLLDVCNVPGENLPPSCTGELINSDNIVSVTLEKQIRDDGKTVWVGYWEDFHSENETRFFANIGIAIEESDSGVQNVSVYAAVGKASTLEHPNDSIAHSASVTTTAPALQELNSLLLSAPPVTIEDKILTAKLFFQPASL